MSSGRVQVLPWAGAYRDLESKMSKRESCVNDAERLRHDHGQLVT